MVEVKFSKDSLESMSEFRKKVLFIFKIKNDNNFPQKCGFLKSYIYNLKTNLKYITVTK